MDILKAKKIVAKEGIVWSNYFDLSYVLNNINQKEFPQISEAIKTLLRFVIKGD